MNTLLNNFSSIQISPEGLIKLNQLPHYNFNPYNNIRQDAREAQLPRLINQFRQLINKDTTSLPSNYRSDDEFLSIFLRIRDYNVKNAFMGLQKTYNYIISNQELFQGLRPTTLISTFNQQIIYCLKSPDPKTKSLVATVHVGSWDTSKTSVGTAIVAASFLGQECITRKATQLYGLQVILDVSGLAWAHVKELLNHPTDLRRIVNGAQDGFPVNTIGIHIINYPSIFWVLYSVAYRLLSKNLRETIHFHENYDSLHAAINPQILPKELGGNLTKQEAIDHSIIESVLKRNEYFAKYYFKIDENDADAKNIQIMESNPNSNVKI